MTRIKRILLIDDDKDDQFFFREALKLISADFTCDIANDGVHGITLLQKSSLPDIIFLDLNMPLMNGFDFLQKIRGHVSYCNIPVVIYTTSSHQRDVEKARILRADAFLTKPQDVKTLAGKLETALNINYSVSDSLNLIDELV